MNMKGTVQTPLGIVAFFILFAFMVTACQQIFTYNVAQGLAGPLALPTDMTTEQAAALAAQAAADGDEALAQALLDDIISTLSSNPPTDPAELAALKEAAIQTALTASGVADVLTGIIGTMDSGAPPDLATIGALLEGVDVGANSLTALGFLTDPGVSPSGDQYFLGAIAIIASEAQAAGGVENLPTDMAGWTSGAIPELGTALDLIQDGVDAYTAEGVDSNLISLIEGSLTPAP